MRFTIERSPEGFAKTILEDGRVIIHLNEGTVRNEENIERIVHFMNIGYIMLFTNTEEDNLNPPKTRKVKHA